MRLHSVCLCLLFPIRSCLLFFFPFLSLSLFSLFRDSFFFFYFYFFIFLKIHDVSYRGRLKPMGARVRRSVSVIEGCRVLPTTNGVGGSVLVDQCRLNGHRILERCRRQ